MKAPILCNISTLGCILMMLATPSYTACTSTPDGTAPAAELSRSAISPSELGDGKLIFDFSRATVTEEEDGTIVSVNRAVKPDEYGPSNRRVVTTCAKGEYSISIAKYSKTGSSTASVDVLSAPCELESRIMKEVLPRMQVLTVGRIIAMLNYSVGDGSEKYDITFTSPTTGTAVVTESGGTFVHTIRNVGVTYIPAGGSATSVAETAAATVPAAPSSLNGSWIRLDYSSAPITGAAYNWFYMHNGSLYRLNSEHPANTVPAKPKRMKEKAVYFEDETGRPYSPVENLVYQPSGSSFALRFVVVTSRRCFHVSGSVTNDDGFYTYEPTPIIVNIDRSDAASISGTCKGYFGVEDIGAPCAITRVTIYR